MKNIPNKLENEDLFDHVDIYRADEIGMSRLLKRMGRDHSDYGKALTYQRRLEENIDAARVHGDTETRRAERSEIINQLNRLTLSILNISFNELCPRRAVRPAARRSVQFTINRDLSLISAQQIFQIQQFVARTIGTSERDIQVNFVTMGSTIIDLSLYAKDLLTLRSSLSSNSESLHQFGIVKVVLEIEDGQQEVWMAKEGRFQLVPSTSSELAPRPSFLALTQDTVYGATEKILAVLNPRRLRDLPIVSKAFFERIAKLGDEFSLQTNPAPAFGLGPKHAPDSLKKLAATYETTRQLTQTHTPAEIQMLIQKNKWQDTLKKQAEGVARKFMGRRDARHFADAYVKEFIGQTDLLLILSANHHSFEF